MQTSFIRTLVAIACVAAFVGACGDDDDGNTKPDDNDNTSPEAGMSTPDASMMMVVPNLGPGVAGKACMSAADCGGAMCATSVAGSAILPVAAPGGYCTRDCATDVECGEGGACVGAIAGFLRGQCFSSCSTDDDCRDEYQCAAGLMVQGLTIPASCRPKPETDQLGDNVAGQACTAAADCSGGTCLTMRGGFMGMGGEPLPGGYCTGDCLEDSHCGAGGVCSTPFFQGLAGSCFQACSSDGDCTRDGFRCRDVGGGVMGCDLAQDPLPDNTSGNACSADADCGGGEGSCATELPVAGFNAAIGATDPAPGGYCSVSCQTDNDCGAGGVCVGFGLGDGDCFKPCATMTDCRDGYLCEERGGGFGANDAGMTPGTLVCAPVPTPDPDADAGT